jgi:serine/threonine protein kinase
MRFPLVNMDDPDMPRSSVGTGDSKDEVGAGDGGAAGRPSPVTADDSTVASGVVLAAKYRLDRELGCGGMGAVWQARNLVLDVDVAIKVLRADLQKPNLSDRLMREARAVAHLGHPNIVRVYDVGHTTRGTPFLVMELLRGVNLAHAISGPGRLDAVTAVRMLLPIAHALACAHEAGFLHRDLKPENIFLSKQAGSALRPVLLDFSIALSWGDLSNRLTQEGTLVGTPAFMSPELAQGDEVTQQGDIWAFTVLLYEAVTGKLPFSNPVFPRLQREIIERPAPTFTEHGLNEEALWTIVERGLRKRPEQRWQNMREMGEALAGWLLDQGIEDDVSNASIRSTWLRRNSRDEVRAPSLDGAALFRDRNLITVTGTFERSWVASRWTWLLAAALLLLVGGGAILVSRLGPGRADEKRSLAPEAGLPRAAATNTAKPAARTAVESPNPPAPPVVVEPPPAPATQTAATGQTTEKGGHGHALGRRARSKAAARAETSSSPAGTSNLRPATAPAHPPLDIKTDF